MRLDAAHRAFEALDMNDFEDVDVVGDDRTAYIDRNWVVLDQHPAAGTKVDTDRTVRLEIAAVSDDGIIDRIPRSSPVGEELAEKADAAKQAKQAELEEARKQAAEEALIGTRPASEWALPHRDGCAEPTVTADITWQDTDFPDVKLDRVDTRWTVDDLALTIKNESTYEIRVRSLFLTVRKPLDPAPGSYRDSHTFSSQPTSLGNDTLLEPGETIENTGLLLMNLSDWYGDYFSLRATLPPTYAAGVGWEYTSDDVQQECVTIPTRSHRLLDHETLDGVVAARFIKQGLLVSVKTCANDETGVLDVGDYYAKNERGDRIDAVPLDRMKLPVAKNSCRATRAVLTGVIDSTWAVRRYIEGDDLPTQWFLDGLPAFRR